MTEEQTKPTMGNWDDDFNTPENTGGDSGGGERRKAKYMKFNGEGSYQIRLVGKYIKFLRHWQPFTARDRVITDPSYKDKDPAWVAKFWPRKTFAIHVIDRADGELKILEKGNSIFKEFADYKTVNDINPAGKNAPDFVIKVEIPGGDKLSTKYTVTAKADRSPLTPEEMAMAKAEMFPLTEMYRATPLEKIQELWDALPEDKKIAPKRKDDKEAEKTEKPEPKAEENVPAEKVAPADEDDLFADDTPAAEEEDSSGMF